METKEHPSPPIVPIINYLIIPTCVTSECMCAWCLFFFLLVYWDWCMIYLSWSSHQPCHPPQFQWPIGRGWLASSSSSSRLVYLIVKRTPTFIVCNTPSPRRSGIFSTQPLWKKMNHRMFSSIIMCYILSMIISIGMILLDNILWCLIYVVMIDLSSVCDFSRLLES